MKTRRQTLGLAFACLCSPLLSPSVIGQDEIIVRGSSRFDVAIGSFGGVAGGDVARKLGALLRETGSFNLKSPTSGVFVVTGSSNGGQVDGTLTGPQGQSMFRRGYRNASPSQNIARLADDVIEAITGTPGIFSSQQCAFLGK